MWSRGMLEETDQPAPKVLVALAQTNTVTLMCAPQQWRCEDTEAS